MKANILCRPESREVWLAARRSGIGGSDIAAIMGISPYRKPINVWIDKTTPYLSDNTSEAMSLGNDLEDPIAKVWAKRTGAKIRRLNALLQHPKYKFALATLDRLIVTPRKGILEVKLVGSHMLKDWKDGATPDYYECQVRWYMMVTGLPYAVIAPLLGGTKLEDRPFERDREIEEMMLEAGNRFWTDHVLSGEPPALDGSDQTLDAIKTLFGPPTKPMIQVPEAFFWVQEFNAAKTAVKEAEERKKKAESELRMMIKDHAEMEAAPGVIVTLGSTSRETIDGKLLKKEKPKLAKKYLKVSTSTTIKIKEEESDESEG